MNGDDRNYFNDRRVCSQAPEKIKVTIYDDDGEETEHELPSKFEVCDVCEGEGKHVNPSIDAGGLTAQDFADDPDFAESYWSGQYDQPCNQCGGKRVVAVVDEEACDDEQKKLLEAYYEQLREIAECDAISRAERAMGA